MSSDDDRTFRVNFTADGVSRLRGTVKDKLNEYMGDYTDDTLVDYVIVLLRNGRRKEEAGKELNVFLGDDSISFVSWLWEHLSSNLHLYLQPSGSSLVDGDKTSFSVEQSQLDHVDNSYQLVSDYEREKLSKLSRIRHNREWKGLVQDETEPLLLRSTVNDNFCLTTKKTTKQHSPVTLSPPKPQIHKKRRRQDEQPVAKRELPSRPMLDAPRRLLQFAVRDAVRTVQHATSRPEPASKRLRSVVSSSTMDSSALDKPQRTSSVARLMGTVTTAIKAAAEAAEDVKVKCPGNVFDRLGHKNDRAEINNPPSNFREDIGGEDEDFDQVSKHLDYHKKSEYHRGLTADMPMVDRNTGIASDSGSDYEGYDNVGNLRSTVGEVSQSASCAPKGKDSLTVQYSVSQSENEVREKTRMTEQESPNTTSANTSNKILNISVNVNTWKPPHYEVSREAKDVGNQLSLDGSKEDAGKFQARLPKTNDATMVGTKNETVASADAPKDIQKSVPAHGSYASSRPTQDADSRIVFVSNVHFGANKDTLSRHFNKFGEVLKVVILTDGATGQATGSAYVEFLRKESAELALSLNGTSFMSRILKVVRRSAATDEANAMLSWPRIARASSFAPRLGRVPYPRGLVANPYRGRLPVKPGARSLQWKRDAPGAPTTDSTKSKSGNTVTTPTGRNLTYTYVRSEPKPEGNLGLV